MDVGANGSIKFNFVEFEDPSDMADPCSLRLASAGEAILEVVGERMNLARERVRQVETVALEKLAVAIEAERSLERKT